MKPERPDELDDQQRALGEQVVDDFAQQVKHQATTAAQGREARFRRLAAEFAHLGAVADELLTLALRDVEVTPDYFEKVTRFGLTRALGLDKKTEPPNVIQGTSMPVSSEQGETTDEQA